eukprot:GHVH01013253.1.p1 GENE.GHVH01013253.1~~GHVH01013253.1.p1  ORF type:complete len:194 (-),score=23.81 GHVH01013253.1:1344-1925(-)
MNRVGLLAVYIRTQDGQIIEVSPALSVPSNYDEFEAMMTNFLLKKNIKSQVDKSVRSSRGNRQTLLRFIKNDLDAFLPIGKEFFGLSVNGKILEQRNLSQWVCDRFATSLSGERMDDSSTDAATVNSDNVLIPSISLHENPIVIAIGAVAKSDPVNSETYPEAELIRISEHSLTASQCVVKVLHAFERAWRIV